MNSRRVVCRAVSVAAIVVTIAQAAFAQQAVGSASVSGTVLDPSSSLVASATVRLRNEDTNQTQSSPTDERGRYRFLYVPVGRYKLSATAPGFASTRVEVTLPVGSALDIPLRLTASANESITVTGEAPLVETARTEIADVITPREVDALPLNGRNYLDLALLAPNVSRTNTRSAERFAETSAVPGTGISVAGQRNLGNTFIVDGLSANDDAADLAGTSFASEVIREFQVITSGGTAEFGRASSGIVNIVTQSGANQFRGRGYGFFRNERWDARNALATRKDPLSQSQFGATGSGRMVADRTFWFGNVERTQQDKNGVVTISPANVTAINSALASFGYRGPSIHTGEFVTGYKSTNAFARIDHTLSQSSRLQMRYSLYDVSSRNARGVGGLSAVTRGTPLDDTDHSAAVTAQTSISHLVFNDARAQWTRSALSAPPNDLIGPAISISGVANVGTSTSSPTMRNLRSIQVADTVTMQHGAHLVKTGGDLLFDHVRIDFPGALQGSYTVTSLANLQRGIYQQFQQAFGEPSLIQSNPNAGIFVQDEWTYSRLTLNAGIRYDLQWLPDPIQLDANNVSPRLGVVWASADRQTVVRGSAGIYFDRIPLRATSNALQRDGVRYKVAVLSFGEPTAPVFPNVLPAFPSGIVTAITTIDPRVQNGRSEQSGVQVERALGRVTSVSLGYSHLRGREIIMSRNINVPTLTAPQAAALGVANLGRPNPRFANVSRYESIGDSWFDGLTLALNARATPWGTSRVSYTLSRSLDTSGNAFFNTPQDNFNIAAEKGPSDNDQRHRLVISGTVGGDTAPRLRRTFGGVQLGYVISFATGVPFNVVAGSDLNADTNNNDRPAGVARNSERQPAVASVDLRLSRSFAIRGRHRLEAILEGFNVLNHVNILAVNSTFGTGATPLATFGQPTLAGDPRQIQLAVRWNF